MEKDSLFWPNNSKDNAFYFHKFVIKSEFGGQGLSKAILDWVKEYGRKNGKDYIRLNFNENREYLKKMYYGNGFQFVAVHSEKGSNKAVLAEYQIQKLNTDN